MARNYYAGVPIGGTIMWAGSIIGLDIPDNFTENYKLAEYVDTRQSSYITASDLPSSDGYYLRGYNSDTFTVPQTYEASNSVSLTLDNMPIVTVSKDNTDFPSFSYSSSEVSGLFSITNNTTSSVISSSDTSSTARETDAESDYGTRYAPYDNASFDWDGSGYLSGSGSGKYPYRSSGSSTYQSGAHSHTTKTDSHEHTMSLSFSSDWVIPEDVMFNSDTQTDVSYTVQTKSIGIQLITRMY